MNGAEYPGLRGLVNEWDEEISFRLRTGIVLDSARGIPEGDVMSRGGMFLVVWAMGSGAWGAEPLPGHSAHGEAFNEGPRQAARLLPGMGKIEFPVTTAHPEAQAFFNQGVAQLHGFWYFEAERSFRQVAHLDPGCAMAYWGMAMANLNNEARARGLLSKAIPLKAAVTPRERLWIEGLETFYREQGDKRDKKTRAVDLIRDLETIVQEHPDDVEAKAFLAWKIWHAKGEAPISSRQAVDALLDQVFAARPDHPAHHYRIHLWDDAKPARALASAARCGQTAPGIAHLWHMPGHTYSKTRRFDDAAWQQEASARVDHVHLASRMLLPDQIHNYAHNQEWLVRTYNELGRAREALALASNLVAIPRHPDFNKLEKKGSSAAFGRLRLLETLEKWERWEDLVAVADSAWISPGQGEPEITRLRFLAGAHYELGHAERLAAAVRGLDQEAARKGPEEKGKAKPADKGKAKPEEHPAARALAEARALEAVLAGNSDAAKLLGGVESHLSPPRLARAWLRLGNRDKAATAAGKLGNDLAGQAAKVEVLLACGKEAEAKAAFGAAKQLAFAMDADLPVAARLREWAERWEPGERWPPAAPVRTDVGERPPLETLGPAHWEPAPAPTWEARGLDGSVVRGVATPHVLLFYLGSECAHCVEQLQAFAAVAGEFAGAGIGVTAVSTESPGEAGRIREKLKGSGPDGLPFPVLCDPGGQAFRAFGAYDDFEREPLHATVFLDRRGRVGWIDSGWKPFTDARFLLGEAKRLLALSVRTEEGPADPPP